MTYRSISLISIFVLTSVVIAVESTVGMPLAGLVMTYLIGRNLPTHLRVAWLVSLSLVIAASLNLSLALTALSILIGWWLWTMARRVISSQTLRVQSVAGLVGSVLVVLSSLQWTLASTVMLIFSLGVSILISIMARRSRVFS